MTGSRPAADGSIALITAGDPRRQTGGNLFIRAAQAALRQSGLACSELVLRDEWSAHAGSVLQAGLLEARPSLVVVDSIALDNVAPHIPWIKNRLGASVMALMLMLPSELAHLEERDFIQQMESRLLSHADHIVVLSPDAAQAVRARGIDTNRISVVLPGKDGVPPLSKTSTGDGTVRFLCVANWSPGKGIHVLIEAMARLGPAAHLDLVGDTGDNFYADYVHNLVNRNGLRGQVSVYGRLEGQDLAERYARASVFVLPSRRESFGIVYAEAMTFGLPVIACRVGPLPWLVGEECGLLVRPDSSDDLCGAMKTLASNTELRRTMGEAAFRRSEDLPTWQESAGSFVDITRGMLRG